MTTLHSFPFPQSMDHSDELVPSTSSFGPSGGDPIAGSSGIAARVGGAGGDDEVGVRPRQRDRNSGPEKGSVLRWTNTTSGRSNDGAGSSGSFGIIKHSGPAYPKYSTVEGRQRTFREWPPALRQQSADLSEAGFYYIGLSDQVKCFYCDGGLRNWQPEDDPWTEHSRWFPKCGFVRLVKGDEFIAKCLASRPPIDDTNVPRTPTATPVTSSHSVLRPEDIPQLMSSALVHNVLSMGIDASRVKMALQRRAGVAPMFETADQLANAAFGEHREQEDRVSAENNETMPAFEGGAESDPMPMPRRPRDTVERRESSATTGSSEGGGDEDEVSSQESQDDERTEIGSQDTVVAAPVDEGPQSVLRHSTSAPLADCETEVATARAGPTKSASLPEPDADLENENRLLKEQRTCKICMDAEIGVVFLPCGHFICCVRCAPALKDCPLCRQPIHGTVKTFMS